MHLQFANVTAHIKSTLIMFHLWQTQSRQGIRERDDVAEKKEEQSDHRSCVDWKCSAEHFGNHRHQALPTFLGILPTTTALEGTTWARWPSGEEVLWLDLLKNNC